jgi:hypothetical protein
MRPRRSLAPLAGFLFFCLSLDFAANASPLTQITFQSPNAKAGQTDKIAMASGDRLPCLEAALQSLHHASSQVLETFELIMSEFHDAAKDLTWTLPKKNILPRPTDWDFTISSSALPDHSLRVKKPNSLGVDDVKQVSINFLYILLTCSMLAI